MKEKLEKAKNFVYDHKEEIAFTALVGACCTVWYLAGKKSGYEAACKALKEKLYPAIQVEDLQILYQGKMRGANYTVSGCMASENPIALKDLCKDVSNFSEVVDEDTPVVAYSILFKK